MARCAAYFDSDDADEVRRQNEETAGPAKKKKLPALSPMDYTAENLRLLATGICGKWFSTEAAIVLV
jgi:hypothetical protein